MVGLQRNIDAGMSLLPSGNGNLQLGLSAILTCLACRFKKAKESGILEYSTSKIMKLMLGRELNKRLQVQHCACRQLWWFDGYSVVVVYRSMVVAKSCAA